MHASNCLSLTHDPIASNRQTSKLYQAALLETIDDVWDMYHGFDAYTPHNLCVVEVQPHQLLPLNLRCCQPVKNPKSSTAQSPLPDLPICPVMMQQLSSTQEHART